MYGTSTGLGIRSLAGLGIHLAQDVGAHKKSPMGTKPTAESELWKRAFWALITIDIYCSAFTGRPRATSKHEYVSFFYHRKVHEADFTVAMIKNTLSIAMTNIGTIPIRNKHLSNQQTNHLRYQHGFICSSYSRYSPWPRMHWWAPVPLPLLLKLTFRIKYSTRRQERWHLTSSKGNSDEEAVLALDSALTTWVDSVPDHRG